MKKTGMGGGGRGVKLTRYNLSTLFVLGLVQLEEPMAVSDAAGEAAVG